MNFTYEAEYISRIYEPYVYLMAQDGRTEIEFKGNETLTLFKTREGAVRHIQQPTIAVEVYYARVNGNSNPHIDFVKVASPGKYKLVDITNKYDLEPPTIRPQTIYAQLFRNPQRHPTYGEYIGWAYFKPNMVCRACGGDTTRDNTEYLSGQDHLDCVGNFPLPF